MFEEDHPGLGDTLSDVTTIANSAIWGAAQGAANLTPQNVVGPAGVIAQGLPSYAGVATPVGGYGVQAVTPYGAVATAGTPTWLWYLGGAMLLYLFLQKSGRRH